MEMGCVTGLVRVPSSGSPVFHATASRYPSEWIDLASFWFIRSPVERHLGRCHLAYASGQALLNTFTCEFVWTSVYISLGVAPRTGAAARGATQCLSSEELAHGFPADSPSAPPWQRTRLRLLHTLARSPVRPFAGSHPRGCAVWIRLAFR